MPLKIICSSCGFVLYEGKELKSIVDVLKKYGYRCPCCLSPLADLRTGKITIEKFEIEVAGESK